MNTKDKILYTFRTIQNLPILILDKLGFVKGNILYTTRSGLQFITRAGSTDIDEIIVITSGYEYPLHLLPRLNKPVVVDIGACIGDFCVYVDQYYQRKAKIYAFEPSRENYQFLQWNLNLNKVIARTFPVGMYTFTGNAFIQTHNIAADQFTIHKKRKTDYDETCKVISLDTFITSNKIKHIDILKIDIEGSEYELFSHKKTFNTMILKVSYIFLECHFISPEKTLETMLKTIKPYFEIIQSNNHMLVLKNICL